MPRRRKLSVEQEAAIRAPDPTKSLRELAAELGGSHDIVRTVIRLFVSAGSRAW